ncbi:MAG: glycosyltransferase family 2 protein [Syntrophales bacterium]
MITFSVVVPNFNQSRFLPCALESLLHQSNPFKLAIMDGGSTDNFRAAVEPHSDIITFLRSGPDAGQAAAIEEGIKAIEGDAVGWLNADDYYFPSTLARVAACFEADPKLDVVYGDAIHVTEAGFFLSYFPPIQEFNASDLTRTCFICQPACFVRRSAYERVGGVNPSLVYTMDWDLWCRLARAGAIFHYLPEPLAAVRYYPGTKTLSGDTGRYREIWRIERQYGHRWLPWSWAGFYFFDLSFKEHKTVAERITFSFLKSLRRMKKRIISHRNLENQTNGTLYGFHRWEPVVVGKGTIHLPWYDKRRLGKILLRVTPDGRSYRTTINGAYETVVLAKEGQFSIDVPLLDKPSFEISIECLDQQRWTLLDFSCE